MGLDPDELLWNNDSYHALEAYGGLIRTGPTGTNVNDLSVLLIRRQLRPQLIKRPPYPPSWRVRGPFCFSSKELYSSRPLGISHAL